MKKVFKKLAVILAAASLTGCQSNIELTHDITNSMEGVTKSDISEAVETTDDISIGEVTDSREEDFIPKLLMETDKPFVLAKENYIIEKQNIDVSVFNEYGFPHYAADGKYYYTEPMLGKLFYEFAEQEPVEEATIFVYDSKSEEYSPLYSEAPYGEFDALYFTFVGLHDNFLYYFREECRYGSQTTTGEGFDLCRLNLENKKSEHIFSLNNEWYWECKRDIAIVGNSLFFYDYHDTNLETEECVHIIRCFDLDTGEDFVFRDDAENVIPYKNGVVYCHDGGYYYHGDDKDITGKGIYYEGDELLFYSKAEGEPEISGISIDGDTAIYSCFTYYPDGAVGNMGIFDKEFNRMEIASNKRGTWCIDAEECKISEAGLISVDAPKPLIYDKDNECFAVIPIDDYSDYRSYATEDSICFFGYADDDYGKYTSAALYTVKRR